MRAIIADINECEEDEMLCGIYGICDNLVGGYTCRCIDNYEWKDDRCVLVCK